MHFLILWPLLLAANVYSAPTEEDFLRVSQSRYWRLIMHYKDHLFTGTESQADGKKYFFAPDGKTNPLSELKASYQAFLDRPKNSDPNYWPQCKLPLRYLYLREELDKSLPIVKCPDFDQWLNELDPEGMALVYANNFPNNPSSTFGHTFLRIVTKRSAYVQKSHPGSKKLELLDYAIGYAANIPPDAFFVSYALNGVLGGYPGVFSFGPYYLKVNEYNHLESRDLWEYHVDVTPEGVRRALMHLWELSYSTHFDYWFFGENCSYHVLALIEVARPEWDLSDHYLLYVSPPETVRELVKVPGAVKEVRYRPSLFNDYSHRVQKLNDKQVDIYNRLIDKEIPISSVNDSYVLEAAIGHYRYLQKQNRKKFESDHQKFYHQLLLQRSKTPLIDDPEFDRIPRPKNPAFAHGDNAIDLRFGKLPKGSYQQFSLRPAIHDLLSDDVGHTPYGTFELFHVKLRWYNQENPEHNRFEIDEIKAGDYFNLSPLTAFNRHFSLAIEVKRRAQKEEARLGNFSYSLTPRVGYTIGLFQQKVLLYFLAGAHGELAEKHRRSLRYGPMAETGLVFRSPVFRSFFRTQYFSLISEDDFALFSLEHAFTITHDLEFRILSEYFQKIHAHHLAHYENSLAFRIFF